MYDQMDTLIANFNGTRVDLRSDTVTKPNEAMRQAMASAEVGDDVYGEDPSIIRLQTMVAGKMGKEAGLFLPSCTQSNLVSMLCHTARGDEVILGRSYHINKYEAGGCAVLGGAYPCPIDEEPDGSLDPEKIRSSIKADDPHFPISKILSLENTTSGKAIPLDRIGAAVTVARDAGMSTHLDGARIFNAATKLNVAAHVVAEPFDSVSVWGWGRQLVRCWSAPEISLLRRCGPVNWSAAGCGRLAYWLRQEFMLLKITWRIWSKIMSAQGF